MSTGTRAVASSSALEPLPTVQRELLPDDGTAGIDWLELSFPIDGMRRTGAFEVIKKKGVGWKAQRSLDLFGAHFLLRVSIFSTPESGKQMWGKIEGNPSRLSDPEGCSLVPVEALPDICGLLAAEVENWMRPAEDWEDWRVKRLDVSRDFRGLVMPGVYPKGLLQVRRTHAKRAALYADAQRGSAQTLMVGNKSGVVRLYDQHAAYADKGAPPGSLRWELEARPDWLAGHGIRTAGDLHASAVSMVAWRRWEWSQCGETVSGTGNVAVLVQSMVGRGELTQVKADRLLGQLVREAYGLPRWGNGGNSEAAEYARLKERLGVVPSLDLFTGADQGAMGRLDFASGTEVFADLDAVGPAPF